MTGNHLFSQRLLAHAALSKKLVGLLLCGILGATGHVATWLIVLISHSTGTQISGMCISTVLEIVLRSIFLAELLPLDLVLGGLYEAFIKKDAIDMARNTFLA